MEEAPTITEDFGSGKSNENHNENQHTKAEKSIQKPVSRPVKLTKISVIEKLMNE